MTPPGQKVLIDHASFLEDVETTLRDNKVPDIAIKALSAFVVIYLAGISLAGAHAWTWATLPATLVALARWGLQALMGQSLNENVVREMANNAIQAVPPDTRSIVRSPVNPTFVQGRPPTTGTPPAAPPPPAHP